MIFRVVPPPSRGDVHAQSKSIQRHRDPVADAVTPPTSPSTGGFGPAGFSALGLDEQCHSPLAKSAQNIGLSTYAPPDQCKAMVVCAGSPRAASTAECTLAEHVLEYMMEDEHRAGRLQQEKATYLGYWNYHLHQLCSDGFDCENKYPESIRNLNNRDEWANALQNVDGGQDIKSEMDNYYSKRDSVEPSSVVIAKSHEFDETLTTMCDRRLVLTSSRDKEEVFDSALSLGWFTQPKEESRWWFETYYDLWQQWGHCWVSATEGDDATARFDLNFKQLSTEGSFRAVVRLMAYELAKVLQLDDTLMDMNGIVDKVVDRDFQRELNPTLTNGDQLRPTAMSH